MNATLTDDRIESMRSTVMNSVDGDIKRRGTRARRVIGLGAASIVIVGASTFGLNAINNGGGPGAQSAGDSSASTSRELDGDAAASSSEASEDTALVEDAAPDAERQVITTGSVSVTVQNPRDYAQKISTYVDSIKGRVDSRSESNDGEIEQAYLQVRVPSSKITSTVDKLKTYGSVTNVTLENSDVTTQAQDLDARIGALKVSIKRLEKIMAEATSSGELIKAETALTQRQEQLESMTAQRASIADQVQLSSLSIELTERTKAESVSAGGFKGGVIDGWNALVDTLNKIVEVVGVALPWTVIAVLLYGVYRLIARRREWN
ncbi:MAG: DUF4349 domain-containing protein [Aeromicrobium sp.]